jgi:MFS family permease
MLPISAASFGAGLFLFGLSSTVWISLALMILVGYGMMQGLTASNTIIQTLVPEDKRGRVMSYYTAAFVGMAPFGSLLAGALAHWIGAAHTVMLTGTSCIVGGALFTMRIKTIRAHMRPIYIEMGIISAPPSKLVEEQAGN